MLNTFNVYRHKFNVYSIKNEILFYKVFRQDPVENDSRERVT